LHSESTAKAELLNDFFSSLFTREIDTDIPVLKPMCDVKLLDIDVRLETIKTRLNSLKEVKLTETIICHLGSISDEIAYPIADCSYIS